MSIQHRDIPNAQLHEPKGINTALVDTLYLADGLGSGSWKTLGTYGSQVITNNAVGFPVTAAADATLNTTSQYTLLSGVGAPWTSENLFRMAFTTDRLTVSVTGIYLISLWMQLTGFPSNTARVALRYRVNGTGAFSTRKPQTKSDGVSDTEQITGFGLLALNAGDFLQLYVASDTTGSIVFNDANNTLQLVRQTA